MEKKYGALRTIARFYRLLGWLVLIFGVLGSCGFLALSTISGAASRDPASGVVGGIFVGIMGLILTAVWGITLLATSDGLYVLLDIEEGIRGIAEGLKKPSA